MKSKSVLLFLLLVCAPLFSHAQATLFGKGRVTPFGQVAIEPLPPQYSLTVAVTGTGTVIASPNGVGNFPISCPPSCSANYTGGTVVTLSESPGSGESFSGWGGDALSCGSSSTCVLTITANTNPTATFTGTGCGISPCSYAARTDSCYFNVTAVASCTLGSTCASVCNPALLPGEQAGSLGALLQFTLGDTDPLPFNRLDAGSNPAVQNTCFIDRDWNTYECWMSDNNPAHMNGAVAGASWGFGSDGAHDAWNRDSTFALLQNQFGITQLMHVLPARIHAQTVTPSNPAFITSNIKSNKLNGVVGTCPGTPLHDNLFFDSSAGLVATRDASDATNLFFELAGPQIKEVTVTSGLSGGVPTGVDCLSRTTIVDFTSDTPVACSVLPQGYNALWQGQASASNTDTFEEVMGGGAPWPAVIGVTPGTGSTPVTTDVFTLPTNNLTIAATITSIGTLLSGGNTVTTDSTFFGYVTEKFTVTHTTNYNGTYTILTADNSGHVYTFTGPSATREFSGTATVTMATGSPAVNKLAFQVTTAGTAGASEPNWIANCPLGPSGSTPGMTCTDGTAVWTNIGGVGIQGPGFDVVNYRPGIGCKRINTRLAKSYNGTGNSEPSGQLMTDDATVISRVGGTIGTPVPLTDTYTIHDGSQPLDARYGEIAPTTGADAFNNTTGSCAATGVSAGLPSPVFPYWPGSQWSSTYNTPTGYHSGNYVSSVADPNHNYYKKIGTGSGLALDPYNDTTNVNWQLSGSPCYHYTPEWATNIVRPCLQLGPNYGCDQHRAEGTQFFYAGGKYFAESYAQPACQTMNANCPYGFNATQGGVTETGYTGGPNPGVQALPIAGCSDGHPTYRNVGLLDLQPFFIPRTDVPGWPTKFTCSTYDMEEGVSNLTSNPGGQQIVWRFGTPFNTGSSALFSIQSAIGDISQMGDLLGVGTDGMDTRGDRITGSSTCVSPFRAMYTPTVGSTTLTVGDTVLPVSANNAQVIYTVTSCGGPSSCPFTAVPTWNSCQTAGCTVSAGGATFTAKGPNTCRADALAMDVLSSHVAP